MGRIVYILILLGSFSTVFGQQGKARLMVNNNFKVEQGGVVLKWISKDVISDGGFNVYRKTTGGQWQKLNSAPIDILQGKSASEFPNDDAFKLYNGLLKSERASVKGKFVSVLGLLKAIEYPIMAEAIGITYYDLSAEKGMAYDYKVMAINGGQEVDLAENLNFTVGDYQKFPAPAEFELQRKGGEVTLSWKEDREAYFGVYFYKQIEEGDFEKVGDAMIIPGKERKDRMQVEDLAISKDTNYAYKIVGIDFFGQETEFTKVIQAPAKAAMITPAPELLNPMVKTREKIINLKWECEESEGTVGFNVYQFKSPTDSVYIKMNPQLIPKNLREYNLQLENEGGNYYIVSTINGNGEETTSNLVFAQIHDLFPPVPPSNFVAASDTGVVRFNWNGNTEPDLAGYIIFKALPMDTAKQFFSRVNGKLITGTTYEMELPKNVKSDFCFYVQAQDTNINYSEASNWQCVRMPDTKAPGKPLIKSIDVDSTGVVITWLSNAEEDIASYELYRKSEQDENFIRLNISDLDKDQYRYIDRRAELGKKYAYQLVAIDQAGNTSISSKPFPIKLPLGPTITAGPSDVNVRYNEAKKTVSLKWKQEENKGLVGFTIYSGTEEGRMFPISGLTQDMTFAHQIEGTEKQRVYQIRAFDENGYVLKSQIITVEIKKEE